MRSLLALITILAIAAGAYLGWLDARRELSRRSETAGEEEPRGHPGRQGETSARAASGGGTIGKPSGTSPGPDRLTPGSSGSLPPSPAAPTPTASSPAALPSAAFERRIDEIEQRIRAFDFAGAEAEAKRLAAAASREERALLDRLAAKAELYRKLLPPPSPPPEVVYEVKLEGGRSITAREVEESPAGYRLHLPNGIRYLAPRDQVVSVERTPARGFLARERKKILERLEKADHAIDIFVRGVRKLLQLGLKKDALDLMEELLRRPDGEEIAIAFGGEASEDFAALWRRAASPPAGTGFASAESPNTPEAAAPRPPPEPRPVRPTAPPVTPRGARSTAAEYEQARRLLQEAQKLYQSGVAVEGGGARIREAYARLKEAQALLGRAPPSDEVRRLRRHLTQLLVDVSKSLPFD